MKKKVVSVFLAVLLTIGMLPPMTALASDSVEISGLSSPLEYHVNQEAIKLSGNITVSDSAAYDGGFLLYGITDGKQGETLAMAQASAASVADGEVSVVGNIVYLGDGTDALQIGSVNSVKNGRDGKPLQIDFSAPLNNGDFEISASGDTVPGWEINLDTVVLGALATKTQGRPGLSKEGTRSPYTIIGPNEEYTFTTDVNYNLSGGNGYEGIETEPNGTPVYSKYVVSENGNKVLRLVSAGSVQATGTSAFGSLFGPEAISSPFDAKTGDTLAFDWKAQNGGDNYEVYGFLEKLDSDGNVMQTIEMMYGRGGQQGWTTSNGAITSDGTYRYRFVCGSYDQSGGRALGASLYLDNIRVFGTTVDNEVVQKIAGMVTYHNSSDTPEAVRNVEIKLEDRNGNSGSGQVVISIPTVMAPSAPAILSAAGGNASASITWSQVPEAAGYIVYMDGNTVANAVYSAVYSVSEYVYSYTAAGLTNGRTYLFRVRATNEGGDSELSNEVSVTPKAPAYDAGTVKTPGADILVNGKPESAGSLHSSTNTNGQSVTTLKIDTQKLAGKLAQEGKGAKVTIPMGTSTDVFIGELTGQAIKNMGDAQAVLEIRTELATYTLPAQLINMNAIAEQLEPEVSLQDITVHIEIAKLSGDRVKVTEDTLEKGGLTLVIPPVEFNVKYTYKGQTVCVASFNSYVERSIPVPEGVDPYKITTGTVVEEDGSIRHVPTRIIQVDSKYYATVSSLTNSVYTVIWNPRTFADVEMHWAKADVNDMAARLIVEGISGTVFNPDSNITRAELAAVMVRALGLKPVTGSIFSDVKPGDWYIDEVKTANDYGIINGYEDGTFRPMDNITREQAMAMVSRAMKITGLKPVMTAGADALSSSFDDSGDVSSWAREAVAECVGAGIISGRNGSIVPGDNITRAEAASVVRRLLQKSGLINQE